MKRSVKSRLWLVLFFLCGLGITATTIIYVLRANMDYFYTPKQLYAGSSEQKHRPNAGQHIQLGGMVKPNSVSRAQDSLKIAFIVFDSEAEVNVFYEGILPDLFSEGQSVVAKGVWDGQGNFYAQQILAKHDENYTPKEVEEAMKENHAQSTTVIKEKRWEENRAP